MNDKQRIIELEKENRFLKEELKKHGYEIPTYQKTLSSAEKIDIYLDYFRGRNDVYAARYYSNKKQEFGWSPVCSNKFKKGCKLGKEKVECSKCVYGKFEPLDKRVISNHFRGLNKNIGIGLYPLLKDNTCYLIAFDFDEDDWFEAMLSVYRCSLRHEIYPLMERSASGNGGHLWIFFEVPVRALHARKLASILLQEAMEINKNIKYDSFDRLFPNQDYMPNGGFGNLIALPLRYDAYLKGNSCFINEYQQKINNPIEHLMTISKVSEELVLKILRKETQDYFFDDLQLSMNLDIEAPYSKEINIKENSMLQIEKKNLNSYTISHLRRLASMYNPDYFQLQRLKKSIYRGTTPRVLCVYEEDDKFLYLPRGTKDKLFSLFPLTQFHIENQLSEGRVIDVSFKHDLYDYQKNAVEEMLKYTTGVLQAHPGLGKTVMGINIISQLKINTLIIVPSKELQNQWMERIEQFLSVPQAKLKRDSFVCAFNGSKKRLNGNIDVAIAGSLSNLEQLDEVLAQYGCIIVDECHHAASNTFTFILRNAKCKYIYGLSATPKREDGLEKIIYMFCGLIRHKISNKEVQNAYQFQQVLIPRTTTFKMMNDESNYINVCNELMNSHVRNTMIVKDVLKEYRDEIQGKIIV